MRGLLWRARYNIPTAIEKDFSPGAEVHGIGINRNADVAEIVSAISRGNIHAPAERGGEIREVAAYANAFVHGIADGGTRIGITPSGRRGRSKTSSLQFLVVTK
jgi:hypothetical protein